MASALKLLEYCYDKLVLSLPLEDSNFLAVLEEHDLVFGNIKGLLESLATRKEKASYFLDNFIKPELENDDHTSFDKLVAVMSNSTISGLPNLAAMITSAAKIKHEVISDASKFCCVACD